MSLATQILSPKNFQEAYFDLVRKMDETSRATRYTGIDGICLNDLNLCSATVIEQAREELMALKTIDP